MSLSPSPNVPHEAIVDLAAKVGAMDQKLDLVLAQQVNAEKRQTILNTDHETRLRGLEKARAWATGVVVLLVSVVAPAFAWLESRL